MSTAKLHILSDKNIVSEKQVTVPDSMSTETYSKNLIQQFKPVLQQIKAIIIVFENDPVIFYYGNSGMVVGFFGKEQFLAVNCDPSFADYVLKTNQAYVGKEIMLNSDGSLEEMELLKIHPEMLDFLPINNQAKVESFVKFVITTLNTNWDPTKSFHKFPGKMLDVNMRKINFDIITCNWLDDIRDVCLKITSENYIWTLIDKIKPEHQKTIQDWLYPGDLERIVEATNNLDVNKMIVDGTDESEELENIIKGFVSVRFPHLAYENNSQFETIVADFVARVCTERLGESTSNGIVDNKFFEIIDTDFIINKQKLIELLNTNIGQTFKITDKIVDVDGSLGIICESTFVTEELKNQIKGILEANGNSAYVNIDEYYTPKILFLHVINSEDYHTIITEDGIFEKF